MTNIKSVTPIGKAQTYDLEVAHPDHQYYLSNGILTSNSHATLYSMISFHTAYLKAHFPLEFLTANLKSKNNSNQKSAADDIIRIKDEIRALGVRIVPPDVNKSDLTYKIINDHTLMTGLDSMKFMGEKAMPEIMSKRPFTSFKDMMIRLSSEVNSSTIKALAASGSLDGFGIDRKKIFYYASDYRAKLKSHIKKFERALAKGNVEESHRKTYIESFDYPFPEEDPWTIPERYAFEAFYLGEGMSGTVPERYKPFFDYGVTKFSDLPKLMPFRHINDDEKENRRMNSHNIENYGINTLKGIILTIFEFKVKNQKSKIFGQLMARVTVQDPFGNNIDMVCFPEAWERMNQRIKKELRGDVEKGSAISFRGVFQWENSQEYSFILGDILDYKPVPSVPKDTKSKKVKMQRSNVLTKKEAEKLAKEDLMDRLNDEAVDAGFGEV